MIDMPLQQLSTPAGATTAPGGAAAPDAPEGAFAELLSRNLGRGLVRALQGEQQQDASGNDAATSFAGDHEARWAALAGAAVEAGTTSEVAVPENPAPAPAGVDPSPTAAAAAAVAAAFANAAAAASPPAGPPGQPPVPASVAPIGDPAETSLASSRPGSAREAGPALRLQPGSVDPATPVPAPPPASPTEAPAGPATATGPAASVTQRTVAPVVRLDNPWGAAGPIPSPAAAPPPAAPAAAVPAGSAGLTPAPPATASRPAAASVPIAAPQPAAPATGRPVGGRALPNAADGDRIAPDALGGTVSSAPATAPAATPTPSPQHAALVNRVLDVVHQQQTQPPPRIVVVDLPELDGLRLMVAMQADGRVHIAPIAGTAPPQVAEPFLAAVGAALFAEGFDLADGSRRHERHQTETPEPAAPPRTATRRRRRAPGLRL